MLARLGPGKGRSEVLVVTVAPRRVGCVTALAPLKKHIMFLTEQSVPLGGSKAPVVASPGVPIGTTTGGTTGRRVRGGILATVRVVIGAFHRG